MSNVHPNRRPVRANPSVQPHLRTWLKCEQLEDRLTPAVAAHLPQSYFFAHPSVIAHPFGTSAQTIFSAQTVFSAPELSLDPITASLHYIPTEDGGVALSWQMVVRTADGDHWYDLSIADGTGEMNFLSDWVNDATYNVIASPDESPLDGGFTILTDPFDTTASPFGCHDTNGVAGAEFTDTRGNNVDAHLDTDDNNIADGVRPNGGAALDFSSFTYDSSSAPNTPQNQAISQLNLFYAINYIHDVSYQYGFTEPAGNFQVNNYGNGGAGNDAVQADAQDGGGTNNANFATPPDGTAPRMQQYIWTAANPDRDSSLDNSIIFHEYGHGISNRLTGGPSNSNALNNRQSRGMGEGWSDFYALMLLQRTGDAAEDGYGIAPYAVGQGPTGVGIRDYAYSYDMSVNPLTFDGYGTSGNSSFGDPRSNQFHYAGSLWASALWDMNWLLIDKYGFDSDLSSGWTAGGGTDSAGNKLALLLVTEALKLQPSNPTFIQSRDAILAADLALNGGADQAEIWAAFARRGLGVAASTTNSNSSALVLSFEVPQALSIAATATVTEGDTGTRTKVFRGGDAAELGGFYAYGPGFQGGVSVATGDLDGTAEILTGAGAGTPHVRAFRGLQGLEVFSLFAGYENAGGNRVG